jgi:hypothetical protein
MPRVKVLWALFITLAAVVAALPPLHEMDLAQHLATGEWIVRHRAVPFTEPFAWTREGQPYFAYSWLAQVAFYVLLHAFGPLALHLLEALLVGGAVVAVLWAARQFGWRDSACFGLGVVYLTLLWGVANILRPQQFLFVAVPLAWGVAGRIRASGITAGRLAALAGIGALAANTHIFFPLTIIPIAYCLLSDGQPRRWAPAAGALVAGWLINPYAFVLPQVFALNFEHNVLLDRPPSIAEFVPGFEYARQRPGVVFSVIALLAAPWIGTQKTTAVREQMINAAFWITGLLFFAYAGRLVFAWWTLAFPLMGNALHRLSAMASEPLRRPFGRAAFAGLSAIVLIVSAPEISPAFWLFEGNTVHRMLPRAGEDPALWLPSWLLCYTRAGANGRIFTEFNYGSELNWRLPGYSSSIDGRTIFPDSVAVDFSFYPYGRRRTHARTWTSADLALLDRAFWTAPLLDQDTAWILLAESRRARGGSGALWARRAWWLKWGTPTALPARDIRPADPRAMCDLTGVFPK